MDWTLESYPQCPRSTPTPSSRPNGPKCRRRSATASLRTPRTLSVQSTSWTRRLSSNSESWWTMGGTNSSDGHPPQDKGENTTVEHGGNTVQVATTAGRGGSGTARRCLGHRGPRPRGCRRGAGSTDPGGLPAPARVKAAPGATLPGPPPEHAPVEPPYGLASDLSRGPLRPTTGLQTGPGRRHLPGRLAVRPFLPCLA